MFGVFRSPQEWHSLAKAIPFPMDRLRFIRPWQARAVLDILTHSPENLVKLRRNALEKIMTQLKEFEQEEVVLHNSMVPHVKRILEGKKIKLLSKLMDEAGVDDRSLADEVVEGLDLTGTLSVSGQFPAIKGGEAVRKSRQDLLKESSWRLASVMSMAKPSSHAGDDEALLSESEVEVERSWAAGPFTKSQLDDEFGVGCWASARRFVIHQSSGGVLKKRLIDDFSMSGHNETIQELERLDHGGLDEVVALVRLLGRCIESEVIDFVDAAGEHWASPVHPGWRRQKINIRTLDLRSAYKQLPVSSADGCVSITCAHHAVKKQPMFWKLHALPFGASSSVFAFNRCARALERIVSIVGLTLRTSYFDDFVFIEPVSTIRSSAVVVEGILKMLGWTHDERGRKYGQFDAQTQVLGALIGIGKHGMVVGNTKGRIDQLRKLISGVLDRGEWRPHEAQSLTGRLNFAKSLVSGRPITYSLGKLYEKACSDPRVTALTEDEEEALRLIGRYLDQAEPMKIPYQVADLPHILYTDGAVEHDVASCGAVLCLRNGEVRILQFEVPPNLYARWRSIGTRHCVAQAELLPVLVAKRTWLDKLRGSDLMLYTDSNVVKHCLVKGTSSSLASRELLRSLAVIDLEVAGRFWVSRVPTNSNPADSPSRGCWRRLIQWLPGVRDAPIWPDGVLS